MRVINQACAIATPAQVSSQALFKVQQKEVDKKLRRPFNNQIEDDTWACYTAVWTKLVCYIYYAEAMADKDRPGYQLSKRQSESLDKLSEIVEAYVDDPDMRPGLVKIQ
jgi:hypothetical protein